MNGLIKVNSMDGTEKKTKPSLEKVEKWRWNSVDDMQMEKKVV